MCGKFLYVTTTPLINAKGLVQITWLPDVFLPMPSCHSHDFTFMILPAHQIWTPVSPCSSTFVHCNPRWFFGISITKINSGTCYWRDWGILCDTEQLYICRVKGKGSYWRYQNWKVALFSIWWLLTIPEVSQQACSCPISLFSFSWQSSSPSYLVWLLGLLHHTLQTKDHHWVVSNL